MAEEKENKGSEMATITQITAQLKNLDRANLYLDGEFFCGISKMALLQNRIEVGQEIDEKELNDLIFESDINKAFDYALSYVAKYNPTQTQLKKKLLGKDFGVVVVEHTIEKMQSYRYIDDKAYAENYISNNKNSKGIHAIRQNLKLKGISEDILKTALNDFSGEDACVELARKQSRNLDLADRKSVEKLMRFLLGRGFVWSEVSASINTIKKEKEITNEEDIDNFDD